MAAIFTPEAPPVGWGPVTVDARPYVPDQLELHRRELTGYCYRMLGSGFEADDAVQETMVRAWKAAEGFEGRSSVRSWLYRIATTCVSTCSAADSVGRSPWISAPHDLRSSRL
jgi:RNA polymerase sigma-70 factor (ECF subfamily)